MKSIATMLARIIPALALAAGATSASAAPPPFPQKPIHIVVGYSPGGTTDIIARLIAGPLAAELGQSVVVDNRPGAGGNIGAEYVARSAPDGYTLQMGTAGNMTVNPSIYKHLQFDTIKDFQAISLIATVPNLMVVNRNVPAKSVREFVAWVKKQPGKVFFASSGVGNTPHMTGELFNIAAGLSMENVPYKGSGPALAALIGGQGPVVMFDNMPSAIGQVHSGQLRALAVTSAKRQKSDPEIPTISEAGYPKAEVMTWFGLFAPAHTPEAVVKKLNSAIVKIVAMPKISEQLTRLGANPETGTPEEFANLVKTDKARWAKVVEVAHIPPM
jgi:tripartite-type tricarboxylate transporter receptor subunit TctC